MARVILELGEVMTELPEGMTWEQWEEIQRRSPEREIKLPPPDIDDYLEHLFDRGEYDG